MYSTLHYNILINKIIKMPPKNKKEEEALRLAEEERKR